MNFKEFHINGKYALLAALVAAIGAVAASAIQVYKPFSTDKKYKKLYVTKNAQSLYTASYVIDEGLSIDIFKNLKQENFSINPEGKKVLYVQKTPIGDEDSIENTIKILNHDTSYSNEIILSSYVQEFNAMPDFPDKRYCQISIKGWEKPNAIILTINGCAESIGFTMMGHSVTDYPQIKMTNGNFTIRENGDYIISFDEFNKVSNVLMLVNN